MANVDLNEWCSQRAAAFRDYEDHEMAMYPDEEARDWSLVKWVVRVLANPQLPESADVLAAIQQHRDGA